MSTSTCKPPETAISDAELPTAATIYPGTENSGVASLERGSDTTTATRWIESFYHVGMVRARPHSHSTNLKLPAIQMMNLSPRQPRGTKFGPTFQSRRSTESKVAL